MNYNIKAGKSFSFFKEAFTNGFSDSNGDSYCEILILGIINKDKGILYYKGIAVKAGDCIPVEKISGLSFYRVSPGAINEKIEFKVSDNNQNKLYSNMATVTINIAAYVNLAPSQVGNLTVPMNHAATKTFSQADFTTGLTPPYQDPEGDAASKLKVLTLPNSGTLKLNGVLVIVNQEIPFTSIASNLFTYLSDANTTTAINTFFTFAISDIGSGQFTS